jgi:hypothetical protein
MYEVEASDPLPSGEHQVRLEFAYDGGGLGKGGTAMLYLDGAPIGESRVERTQSTIFAPDSTALVGNKTGAPIGPDLQIEGNPFNGTIKGLQIDLMLSDADHLVSISAQSPRAWWLEIPIIWTHRCGIHGAPSLRLALSLVGCYQAVYSMNTRHCNEDSRRAVE